MVGLGLGKMVDASVVLEEEIDKDHTHFSCVAALSADHELATSLPLCA